MGKNNINGKTFLEKRYSENMELEDAVHTAILTLKEGFEGQMTEDNIEDGVKVFNISSSEGGVRAVFMVSPKYFVLPDIVRLKVERNYILDGAWAPFW